MTSISPLGDCHQVEFGNRNPCIVPQAMPTILVQHVAWMARAGALRVQVLVEVPEVAGSANVSSSTKLCNKGIYICASPSCGVRRTIPRSSRPVGSCRTTKRITPPCKQTESPMTFQKMETMVSSVLSAVDPIERQEQWTNILTEMHRQVISLVAESHVL